MNERVDLARKTIAMLVITLGTMASGSTWVFNAVRALCAEVLQDTVDRPAGDASDL